MATLYLAHRVWTGLDDSVIEDAAILVDDGLLVAVGPRVQVASTVPQGTPSVQLGPGTVIPGLIDAHVHLQFPLRARGDFLLSLVEPTEFTALKAARNAQVYLAAGFTTVFDCGCRGNIAVALREAISQGLAVGPRVVASGLPLSPTAGWVDEYAPFIDNHEPQGRAVDTRDEWLRAIRQQVKDGVDNVKIGVSGSSLNPYSRSDLTDMSQDEIAYVVEIAHRAGVRVAAHCDPAEGLRASVRAGVDTLHHGKGMTDDCRELLGESRTFYVPTAMKYQALAVEGARFDRPAAAVALFAAGWGEFQANLARSIDAGLADRIAIGSDAGNLPPSHGTTAREIGILVECGMTPFEAMRSATIVASRAAGVDTLVGSLEPGKFADFVLVDGDPLRDVTVLEKRENIVGVYKSGSLAAERGVVEALDLAADPSNVPTFARHQAWTRNAIAAH